MIVFFVSCEKNISLNLKNQSPVLVVDASIENNQAPLVVLSSSLNYFNTISPAQLSAAFVHNAVVTVGDGTTTATLKEYSVTDSAGYKYFYYTDDQNNPPSYIIGALNKQYQLTIKTTDGNTYTAATTIPPVAKKCDSLWWTPSLGNPDTTLCVMYGRFTDPPGLGNYIRYFTRVDSQPFLAPANSVFDDEFTDGKTYNISFFMGYDRTAINENKNDIGYAHRDDTVTLKFCNIDKATYEFWNTWEFAYQSTGNPFSSPVKVIGNISNGALGAFSGYGAQYKTIIIPK